MSEEAGTYILKAEKALKTSLLKWKPDYDSAIEYYNKAALAYRKTNHLTECAACYKKVATFNQNIGSTFHAAKALENAAFIYQSLNDFNTMADLIQEAGKLLRENGNSDYASNVFEKGAKCLESYMPERAAVLYENSADACEIEEKFSEASDQANNAARMWTKLRRFVEVERLLRLYVSYVIRAYAGDDGPCIRGIGGSASAAQACGKAATVLILTKLHQEDEVAARKIYDEAIQSWRFAEANDFGSVTQLLQAIESGDADTAKQAVKAPCFRLLELDYARLIREIKFPSSETLEKAGDPMTTHVVTSKSDKQQTLESQEAGHSELSLEHGPVEEEEDIC